MLQKKWGISVYSSNQNDWIHLLIILLLNNYGILLKSKIEKLRDWSADDSFKNQRMSWMSWMLKCAAGVHDKTIDFN